jgi:hypothetical protein
MENLPPVANPVAQPDFLALESALTAQGNTSLEKVVKEGEFFPP